MTALADRARAGRPRPRSVAGRILAKPTGLLSIVTLLVVIGACALAPLIAPAGPLVQDLLHVRALPSLAHPLGTDYLGRDVLSRLLYGGRPSLLGVAEAVGTIVVVSVPAGLAAGYFGGRTDRAVSYFVDLLLSIPSIILVLAVLAVFGSNMAAAMVTFGLLGSAGVIRVIRSAVLSIREELYITAARVMGVSDLQIIRRHVLPRALGPIIIQVSLWCGIALGIETGIAFLGLGVTPPAPSWGGMVADAGQQIYQDPWLLVPSGGIIAITILAFSFLGDAVRDATSLDGLTASPAGRGAEGARPKKRRRAAAPAHALDTAPVTAASPPAAALCSVRDLSIVTVGVDLAVLVDQVSLEITPGEIVGVVGESGSGKTLTALAIMGLLPDGVWVSGGEIMVAGRALTGMSEAELSAVRGSAMGMVFQNPMTSLDPSFTIGSQLVEIIRHHERLDRRAARLRAVELLASVRMVDPAAVMRRFPHEMSGGMAQRVCLAIALAGRPKLLIADEPTTALDVTVQAEILALLRTLCVEAGVAILLVTHDWGVVAELCDRAVVMYAGQVVEQGPVERVFANPHHPYTAALQRCNPEYSPEADRLPAIDGVVPSPYRRPTGCAFANRCGHRTERCGEGPVPMTRVATADEVRCVEWQRIDLSTGSPRAASQ
jgi:peptide/nickel transport system permease protein